MSRDMLKVIRRYRKWGNAPAGGGEVPGSVRVFWRFSAEYGSGKTEFPARVQEDCSLLRFSAAGTPFTESHADLHSIH